MNLHFNQSLAKNYHSEPQKVRVLSEAWVKENSYCTNCSAQSLAEFANNKPVADFYCENCNEQYELKSKKSQVKQCCQ
ncbi:DpnI domain-containing protein [Psychrobacter sp. JCM 18901]|uniref:DpnI domain-containing protein n=1 Tax=Psychrobacter sp. JCM 18901 TaxID=1298609 RepID=UPI0004B13470|nr:DpnI domain-containing protein [Psychrobacter sp. JCM 18901]